MKKVGICRSQTIDKRFEVSRSYSNTNYLDAWRPSLILKYVESINIWFWLQKILCNIWCLYEDKNKLHTVFKSLLNEKPSGHKYFKTMIDDYSRISCVFVEEEVRCDKHHRSKMELQSSKNIIFFEMKRCSFLDVICKCFDIWLMFLF